MSEVIETFNQNKRMKQSYWNFGCDNFKIINKWF